MGQFLWLEGPIFLKKATVFDDDWVLSVRDNVYFFSWKMAVLHWQHFTYWCMVWSAQAPRRQWWTCSNVELESLSGYRGSLRRGEVRWDAQRARIENRKLPKKKSIKHQELGKYMTCTLFDVYGVMNVWPIQSYHSISLNLHAAVVIVHHMATTRQAK